MGRIALILMTVLGLNAANVPGSVGEAVKNVGGAGNQIASLTGDVFSQMNIGSLTKGLNIGKSTQASVLGGLQKSIKPIFVSGNMGNMFSKAKPINVAQVRIAGRNKGFGLSL